MSAEAVFELSEKDFDFHERPIAHSGEIAVSAFRYATGLAALRIRNKVGEIIVLPFHGQQVWDATFHGRRLTMGSIFDEPIDTPLYTRNYGAFLVHCGVTAIGNPAPEDTHPLHGEVPNTKMDTARLAFGSDQAGAYVRVFGEKRERVAFSAHYTFAPSVRLGADKARLDVHVAVTNHRASPMELMYLAHVNFRPVDGARLVDAVADDPSHFRVRRHLPIYRDGERSYRELMDAMAADPAMHRLVLPGRRVAPELVAGMDCLASPDGWSDALQILPDGTADWIAHRPEQLPRAVRWMTRNGDEDALGLVLPATAEADGRAAEMRKGNVQMLAPGATWTCDYAMGGLTAPEAEAIRARIADVKQGRR